MSIEMDIQLNLEFPSISSGIHFNLSRLAESIFTANPGFHYFARSEVIRFNFQLSFARNGSFFWLPIFSFERKNNFPSGSQPLWTVYENQKPIPSGFTFQYFSLNETNADTKFPPHEQALPPQFPLAEIRPQNLPQWVQDASSSIKHGNIQLCKSGVGGTYFVYDPVTHLNNSPILSSVFKPVDEEPGAPNNPKQIPPSFVPMMPWGKGAHREVAAFKLDNGFVGVPETYFVEVTNNEGIRKEGSLQKFVQIDGDCSDVGANKFSVEDVHRIGIFDIKF